MSSYLRSCRYCGSQITMTDDTSDGHWLALDPATGGPHSCAVGCGWGSGRSSAGGWTFGSLSYEVARNWCTGTGTRQDGESYTFATQCFMCQAAPVFVHSNGYGDFVLFDPPLGPPWPIHGCFELLQGRGREESRTLRDMALRGELRIHDPNQGVYDLTYKIGLVHARVPADHTMDSCRVSFRGKLMTCEVDYWRLGPRAGRIVWPVRNQSGNMVDLIPIPDGCPDDVEQEMVDIVERPQRVRLKTTEAQQPKRTGLMVAVEHVPLVVVADFGSVSFRSYLLLNESRLVWILTRDEFLIPVLVKKIYGNQRPGTRQTADGPWEKIGSLWCICCPELR